LAFKDKLAKAEALNDSLLCVGLDPFGVPVSLVADFNQAIIESTSDLVSSYKPNLAIYEGMGTEGMAALQRSLRHIPQDLVVIGDGKRGDIENCGESYALALFERYGFDAATLYAYMDEDAIEPFRRWWPEKAVLILCRTSNRRSVDTQLLETRGLDGVMRPIYLEYARQALSWGSSENIGLVVGATFPEDVRAARQQFPDVVFLIPGIGSQGGSIEPATRAAMDRDGRGFILSASRSIAFAAGDPKEVTRRNLAAYAKAARQAAADYREEINAARSLAALQA